jgi:mannose-6-phosphate isomerase-like protein (cupin superfamily)
MQWHVLETELDASYNRSGYCRHERHGYLAVAVVSCGFGIFDRSRRLRGELLNKGPSNHSKASRMKGFKSNIERDTLSNGNFRRVVYTGKHSQLVLMNLKPSEEIGEEVHKTVDQFFRFEKGEGIVSIDGTKHKVADGDAVIVPAGARHNVTNTSKTAELKLYTIYSPPEHQDGTVHKTKADALAKPEEFDGKTTE